MTLYGHLIKQQGTPLAHLDQFVSYVRSTLWKTGNLLMYIKLSVKDYVKMGLSKLQMYYQKTVGEDRKEVARILNSPPKLGKYFKIFKLFLIFPKCLFLRLLKC